MVTVSLAPRIGEEKGYFSRNLLINGPTNTSDDLSSQQQYHDHRTDQGDLYTGGYQRPHLGSVCHQTDGRVRFTAGGSVLGIPLLQDQPASGEHHTSVAGVYAE